jgi:hypothetical protein
MEYYLISLIISLVLVGLIQVYEYNKYNENDDPYDNEKYSLINMNNLLLFIVLYIVITISFYYLNVSKWNIFDNIKKVVDVKTSGGGENVADVEDFDPKILSKINDNFNVGFEPFNEDSASVSSLSSIENI